MTECVGIEVACLA